MTWKQGKCFKWKFGFVFTFYCCSAATSCPTLWPTPWTAAHQASLSFTISQFAQTHVHWVGDIIQPSHPLLPSSPFDVNLSQHQGLFQWVGSLDQVAKVLELQLQQQSFQRIIRVDFLSDWLVGSPCSSRDSQESSPAPQFKRISFLVLSLLYDPTLTSVWLLEKL